MKLDRRTRKLFYEDMYLSEAAARIVKIGDDYIELDATVAYPEGGGQEADQGLITMANGRALRFVGAKKLYGYSTGLPEFSGVQVEGVIWHLIDPQDQAMLTELEIGADVTVSIDVDRRARLSLSHTASHLLYLGVGMHRPDAIKSTLGCHIKSDGARFDFGVTERFTSDQIAQIETSANAFVARDAAITVSAHPTTPDARRWHCDQHVIPCGGTHIDRSASVGMMEVRRKSVGSGKERLSCHFPSAVFDLSQYHK